jgi:transposase
MATIEILGWKENFTGSSGWDDHAKAELKKRLRRGVKAPPGEIRELARQINSRQNVHLNLIFDEAVYPLTQILQAMGAEIRVLFDNSNTKKLFRNTPKRGLG